jgi:hypothetical protein
MKILRSLSIMACLALLWAAFTSPALADQRNQATKVTFNSPVEVPGTVLPAGNYLFTVMPDDPARSVVQIWNSDHTKFYTTALTVPDYRRKPAGQPVLMLQKTGSGPAALQSWFYPGDNFGHDFVYSQSRARELAKESGEPVPSMPDDVAANGNKSSARSANDASISAMKNSQLKAERPGGEEVDIYEVIATTPAQAGTQYPR